MKKQLLILSVLALGYTASSQTAGVFVMAQMSKIKETMAAGTTQKVNAHYAGIVSTDPKVAGQAVIELSETKKGKWVITALNEGTAVIELKKDKSGHKEKKHHCKHTITVTPAKTTAKKVKEKAQSSKKKVKAEVEKIEKDLGM